MTSKQVTIHYRRYLRGSEPSFGDPLSVVVGRALRSSSQAMPLLKDVSLRRYEDSDGASIVLNGNLLPSNGDVFGEILRYNPDTNIPLVFQSADPIAELELGEASKPNGADFLKGMLFFMLRGDHAFLIEQDLTAGSLERYLRWLIFTRAKVAERDSRVQLIPRALLDDDADLFEKVSKITLAPSTTIPNALGGAEGTKLFAGSAAETDIIGILRAAHFDTAVLDRLARGDETAVKITVSVEFKHGRRRQSISGEDAVALLRHVPEEELIVKGDGAQRNRGAVERLSRRASVEQKGNVLDKRAAFAALNEEAAFYREKGLVR